MSQPRQGLGLSREPQANWSLSFGTAVCCIRHASIPHWEGVEAMSTSKHTWRARMISTAWPRGGPGQPGWWHRTAANTASRPLAATRAAGWGQTAAGAPRRRRRRRRGQAVWQQQGNDASAGGSSATGTFSMLVASGRMCLAGFKCCEAVPTDCGAVPYVQHPVDGMLLSCASAIAPVQQKSRNHCTADTSSRATSVCVVLDSARLAADWEATLTSCSHAGMQARDAQFF